MEEDLVNQEHSADDALLRFRLRVFRELDLEGVGVGDQLVLEAGPNFHDGTHLREYSLLQGQSEWTKSVDYTLPSFEVEAVFGRNTYIGIRQLHKPSANMSIHIPPQQVGGDSRYSASPSGLYTLKEGTQTQQFS